MGVNRVRFAAGGGQRPPRPGEPPSPIAGLGAWLGRDLPTWPFMLDLTRYLQRSQAVLQQGTNVVPVAVLGRTPLMARLGHGRTKDRADAGPYRLAARRRL